MWHIAEEAYANRSDDPFAAGSCDWRLAVASYAADLTRKYPFPSEREKIGHWQSLCLAQFPHYVRWWQQHPDMIKREPLLSEQVFRVPYSLPSGRVVHLRGKWDSVDFVADGPQAGVWVQENKSKSSIDAAKIARQVTYDLQSMLYVTAFKEWQQLNDYGEPIRFPPAVDKPIRGVRYNVVRRSAHKSAESMVKKIEEDVANGRGGEWFARWNVDIGEADIRAFKRQTLDPVLENLCDDWEWWSFCHDAGLSPFDSDRTHMTRECEFPGHVPRHYRKPYGIYDPVAEGGTGETDHFMNMGSDAGLVRVDDLFPELREVKP